MIWTVAFSLLGLMALSIPVGIVLFILGIGVGEIYSAFPLLRGLGQRGGEVFHASVSCCQARSALKKSAKSLAMRALSTG